MQIPSWKLYLFHVKSLLAKSSFLSLHFIQVVRHTVVRVLLTALGMLLLHTLYGQAMKHNTQFFVEYFALDLIMNSDGKY